jgi:hypothetical protein
MFWTRVLIKIRLFSNKRGIIRPAVDGREGAGDDLEPENLLVARTVCTPLDDTDIVVAPLDEAGRYPFIDAAVLRDAFPSRQSLKNVRANGRSRSPTVAEGRIERICGAQSLIGVEYDLQFPAPREFEIRPMGEHRVPRALDEGAILATMPGVFGASVAAPSRTVGRRYQETPEQTQASAPEIGADMLSDRRERATGYRAPATKH